MGRRYNAFNWQSVITMSKYLQLLSYFVNPPPRRQTWKLISYTLATCMTLSWQCCAWRVSPWPTRNRRRYWSNHVLKKKTFRFHWQVTQLLHWRRWRSPSKSSTTGPMQWWLSSTPSSNGNSLPKKDKMVHWSNFLKKTLLRIGKVCWSLSSNEPVYRHTLKPRHVRGFVYIKFWWEVIWWEMKNRKGTDRSQSLGSWVFHILQCVDLAVRLPHRKSLDQSLFVSSPKLIGYYPVLALPTLEHSFEKVVGTPP